MALAMRVKLCDEGESVFDNHYAKLGFVASSYGGGEGSRTPVRKPGTLSISERSLQIDIPSAGLLQTGYRFQ